ncbi:hypothetical protein N665_3173s0002 [Sinapis alba]|nr:hypothetical protein N665_3173s0002 [Sinapis alba]
MDEIYNSTDPTQKTQSSTASVYATKKKSISITRPVPDRKIHRDRFFGFSPGKAVPEPPRQSWDGPKPISIVGSTRSIGIQATT